MTFSLPAAHTAGVTGIKSSWFNDARSSLDALDNRTGLSVEEIGSVTSANIQTALDQVGTAGGGIVVIKTPGTYNLASQGTNPYNGSNGYCIDFQYDNTALILFPGVVLKLADGEQTDGGGAIDVVVFQDRTGLAILGYPGARITGNTAGQTGWTGGYAQITNGCLIYGYKSATSNHDILVSGLQLDDHFSNPVNVDNVSVGTPGTNIRFEHIKSFDCGEGPQIIRAERAHMEDVEFEDASNVAVGDGVELSHCTDFSLSKIRVLTNGAGAAIDLFGCRDGSLSDFVVDGWAGEFLTAGTGTRTADRIAVANGIVKNVTGPALWTPPDGDLVIRSVLFKDCPTSQVQITGAAGTGEVKHSDVIYDNCGEILVQGERLHTWNDVTVKNAPTGSNGINIQKSGTQIPEINWTNVVSTANDLRGLVVDGQGASFVPTGLMVGCDFSGNTNTGLLASTNGHDITAINSGSFTGLELKSSKPSEAKHQDFITCAEVIKADLGANIATLGGAHKNQIIRIQQPNAVTRTLLDKSDGSGDNFNLNGSSNQAINGTNRDSLTLQYDADLDEFIEIGRSIN